MRIRNRKRKLSQEEWVVLLDYYFQSDEAEHTDSHPKLQKLAEHLGRAPSTLDACLRNIMYVNTDGQRGLENIGALGLEVFEKYRGYPMRLHFDADRLLREHFSLVST